MSEERYFVIRVSPDGASLTPLCKEGLLTVVHEDENSMMRSKDSPILEHVPRRGVVGEEWWDLAAETGTMIIKGKIVVPKEKQAVTEYEVE